MKIALSGEERAIVALYLSSFTEHYITNKNKQAAKHFNKTRNRVLLNSDAVDLKKDEWSFILRALLEGKRLIVQNMPDVDKLEDENEKKTTKDSMEHAMTSISTTVKKIQESI
jgi:hypothetical protein